MRLSITPTAGYAGLDTSGIVQAWREWRERGRLYAQRRALIAETERELYALSDRDLADIGISRSDVARLARDAAARI